MRLILYGHPRCSLCDRLEQAIDPWMAANRATLIKRDITTNTCWYQRYRHRIPVLVFNDREILEGRPEAVEIEQAMGRIAPG